MVNPELMAFAAFLRQRDDLCLALREVDTPEQIVALAQDVGFRFSVTNLREALPLLGGSHWAWAGRDPAWVLAFFAGAFAGGVAHRAGEAGGMGQVEWLHERGDDWRRRKTG